MISLASLVLFLYSFYSDYLTGDKIDKILSKINRSQKNEEVISAEKESVFKEALKPIYGLPEKILIDSLGISVEIVAVSVDENGYLESPEDWNVAGWYKKSAKPSEIGNLLINAHYDNNNGGPAAFWKLKNIKLDDKVTVVDSYGKINNYKVVNIYFIGIDDPERSKVFQPFEEDKSVMTLITCGGVWIAGEENYSKRLVVNAELIH